MKKAFLMLALSCAMIGANAQIATENSKFFDNWSAGVNVGVQTPLDFNSVFPLNTTVGLNLRKDLTPVVGLQAEYSAWLNDNHFNDAKTLVKAGNLGLNGVINWSNLIGGYKGAPRVFEISTVTGIGWLHKYDAGCNHFTAKTGLDLAFNLGKAKANSLVVSPAVHWDLNKTGYVRFNKQYAQLGISIGFVHHFKTSNGTHHFKIHDIGALDGEILDLRGKVDTSKEVIVRMHKALREAKQANDALIQKVQNVETNAVATAATVVNNGKWVVQFAKNSAELTDNAKTELDGIATGATVTVEASASPEGTKSYNQALSERRANAVVEYLTSKGVKVNVVKAVGAATEASNRIAIVTTE